MSSIAAIPGFNVRKIGNDKYSVAVNNGNMGAVVVNKAQLKQLADSYGVPVKEEKSTAKKIFDGLVVAGAAAGIATTFVYRKNIVKTFVGLKDGKLGKAAENLTEKAGEFVKDAKGKVSEFARTVKVKQTATEAAGKVRKESVKWYDKAAEFIGKAWAKIKDFVTMLFGGKVQNAQPKA